MFVIIKLLEICLKFARGFALALICWFILPAGAAQYTFPGSLPTGCVDNTGGNYTCGSLALAAGDRLSIGPPQPATITFEGALSIGADAYVNTGPGAAVLTLVVRGALALGSGSVLNASVQTLGTGAVTLGANSEVTGAISTQNASVSLGAPSKVGGSITTVTGDITVGADSFVGGSLNTTTGFITLGASAVVNGAIGTAEAGYVVLGASSQVNGNIDVRGDGYVTLGDSASASGDINTVSGAITLGANSQVAGSTTVSQNGAVTLGASSGVGGNITTEVGDVTVGAGGTINGSVSVNSMGAITIGAGGKVYAVCCKAANSSCVSNTSNTDPPPLTCPVSLPANFECLQTGAVYNNALTDPGLKNRLYTKLAGTAFTLDLVALKTDGAIAKNYAGAASRNVRLELVNGEGSGACSSRAMLEPDASQVLTFGATDTGRKTATVTLKQSHANLRCRVTDANQATSVVGCSTDNFSVRPSAVVLQAAPTATAPSSTSLPAIAAGTNFVLRALTTAGNNYSGQLLLDTDKLTAQLPSQDTVVQDGGTVGLLQPLVLPANATAQTLGNYGEVGYLYLAPGAYRDDAFTAVDSASGDCITRTTNNENLADTLIDGKYGCSVGNQTAITWGRFYPDHLAITPSSLTAACNIAVPFTYFAEDGLITRFSMTAKNTLGDTTKNYSAAFAKFNLDNYFAYQFDAAQLPAGSVLAGSSTTPGGGWFNGTAQVVAKHQISRPPTPSAETLILLTASPSDGEIRAAAAAPVAPVGVTARLRYGRLQFKNAYGSELLALPVPLEAQYWTKAGYYITNVDDSCTMVAPKTIVMRNYTGQLNPCKTQLLPALATKLIAGKLPGTGVVLTKPGAGNGGSVDLSINLGLNAYERTCVSTAESFASAANQPWFGTNPTARATFGIYKSTKIYSRENY